jgi:hypothetical protein
MGQNRARRVTQHPRPGGRIVFVYPIVLSDVVQRRKTVGRIVAGTASTDGFGFVCHADLPYIKPLLPAGIIAVIRRFYEAVNGAINMGRSRGDDLLVCLGWRFF